MKIAVLITCHNRRSHTLECLDRIFKQKGVGEFFTVEVFLVDDASTDGTKSAVETRFPQVNIIPGDGNLYWNRGMNLAWKTAVERNNFDFFLWLNDDTNLFEDAFWELLECNQQVGGNLLICGAICSSVSGEFTYGGATKNGIPVTPNGLIQECLLINGNCVLVNKGAYDLAGNIDSVFLHAIGDHDYGFRLLKAGGRCVTTRRYVGNCERNAKLPKWCYSSTPLRERVKALYSPLGNSHPMYYFIYERRHFGLFVAIKHYITIHIRVLIPDLWK